MRYLAALIILIGGSAAGFLVYRHLTAGPAVVLPAPTRLEAATNGTPLLPGGWTNVSTVTLTGFTKRSLVTGADFEVRPQGVRFTETPTSISADPSQVADNCNGASKNCATPSSRVPAVHVRLNDGAYHWQVRLHNKDGISPWRVYAGVVHVDTQPPSPPAVSSPTDPDPKRVYHSSTLRFAWQAQDDGSGVAGYAYRLDKDPHGQPRQELRTSNTSVTLAGLDTGTYYLHVLARDNAGNWGSTTTFPTHIDVTPPGLAHVRFNEFAFDPQFQPLRVSFVVTRPATTVRVGIYRQNDGTAVRLFRLGSLHTGQAAAVWWHGTDAIGQRATPGAYRVYIRAVDRWGHSSLSGWSDFLVNYKRIVVSLRQQKLWAYDGDRLLKTSLVTTGNRALPTPRGIYAVMGKFHPFTFHSPWPKSSPYYYQPSKVEHALLFRDGGYFIHDAPWRSAFGPGTNAALGKPGNNYTGTHGCINTPPGVAAWLYDWAPDGTVVQVTA
ncbi:MAG: hypothetical protein NVS2B16_30130 [Chloroflexota bacterium]